MKPNDLKNRTKKFALDCITLTEKLPNTYLGRHIIRNSELGKRLRLRRSSMEPGAQSTG